MKATFKLGSLVMKAEVNEHGDLGEIDFEMSDIEQDIEVSKEEIPELVKSLVANAKETRETFKVLRHEVTLFVKDIKAIIDGDDVAPGTTITRTVDDSRTEEEKNFELKFN